MSNKQVLAEGYRKAWQKIKDACLAHLQGVAPALFDAVRENRGFTGFTGNTQTSYMIGLYKDGNLVEVISQPHWQAPPMRKKVPNGEWVYLRDPYEGDARSVRGSADVDNRYGSETSLALLRAYKACRDGVEMVMTTGTEYSVLLELKDMDVLTGTYMDAPGILKRYFGGVS